VSLRVGRRAGRDAGADDADRRLLDHGRQDHAGAVAVVEVVLQTRLKPVGGSGSVKK
jgi:hypothetical protein